MNRDSVEEKRKKQRQSITSSGDHKLPCQFFLLDKNGHVVGDNPLEFAESKDVCGKPIWSLVANEGDAEIVEAKVAKSLFDGKTHSYEVDGKGGGRYRVWLERLSDQGDGLWGRAMRVPANFSSLSPKEREALDQLAEGHAPKAIAGQLAVSDKTVYKRLQRVKVKLGLSEDESLAVWAGRHRCLLTQQCEQTGRAKGTSRRHSK